MTDDELWTYKTKTYRLNINAVDEATGDTATLTGSFRVFGDHEKYYCSANMINVGTQPVQESLEYISVGNGLQFKCKIRDTNDILYTPANGPCKSNVFLKMTNISYYSSSPPLPTPTPCTFVSPLSLLLFPSSLISGGEYVRSITVDYFPMVRNIYSLDITNFTPGNYSLSVKPTEGCSFFPCYKSMQYKFTVAD